MDWIGRWSGGVVEWREWRGENVRLGGGSVVGRKGYGERSERWFGELRERMPFLARRGAIRFHLDC
jgi:hypothetical protein